MVRECESCLRSNVSMSTRRILFRFVELKFDVGNKIEAMYSLNINESNTKYVGSKNEGKGIKSTKQAFVNKGSNEMEGEREREREKKGDKEITINRIQCI